jgi:hypothetical protein
LRLGLLFALSAETGWTFWTKRTGPGGFNGGLSWGIASDDKAVYYTQMNTNRELYTLPDGSSISNSAFGAISLLTGEVLWQVSSPRNTTTYVPPTVMNNVVLVGITGNLSNSIASAAPPGSLLVLDKKTGRVLQEHTLDGWFHGAIAAVGKHVFLGTGYGGDFYKYYGSFQTWALSS